MTFEFSPLSPVPTINALVFVLGVTLIKEALEDFARHKSDAEVNQRIAQVIYKSMTHAHKPFSFFLFLFFLYFPLVSSFIEYHYF